MFAGGSCAILKEKAVVYVKNILLIGDSIRIGYDKAVKESLQGRANVYFPGENCRFACYVLRYLHEYKQLVPEGKVDILHWNAGLWDCLRLFGEDPQTPIEVYAHYIDRICVRIGKLFPGAKVIFATSTAVLSEQMDANFKRYNPEIEAYNAAAVEVVKRYGFTVNDLYTVSAGLPEGSHSDPVHYYTPVGTEAFTKQVLAYLTEAAGWDEVPQYREVIHCDSPIGI